MNYKMTNGIWHISFQDANGNTVEYTHPAFDYGTQITYNMIKEWLPDPETTIAIFEQMAANVK